MKKLLPVFLLVLGSGNLLAQYASLRWENITSPQLQCVLTRSWDPNNSVVYGWHEGELRMYLCSNDDYYLFGTPSLIGDYCVLPSYLTQIYDMRILDDHVYFCGETEKHEGFIGYINLNDYSSSASTSYVNVEYYVIPEVTMMKRLAVYYNSLGIEKVVAIGQEERAVYPYVYLTSAILEVDDILGSPVFQYATLPDIEALHEVFFSDYNFGVYFVEYNKSTPALGLRRANPDNVLGDPIIDNYYYYPTGDMEVYSQTHSAISNDRLAVSYLYGGYSNPFSTRIRYFELSTLTMFNSQEFFFDGKSEPYDITFLDEGNRAVLVQPFEFPLGGSFNSNFVWLDPNANRPYTDNILFHKDEIYQSLDNVDEFSFISCGQKFRLQQNWDANFATPSPSCPFKDKYDIEIIDNVNPWHATISPSAGTPTIYFDSDSGPVINEYCTFCFEL